MIDHLPSDISGLFGHLALCCFPEEINDILHASMLTILLWILWAARLLHIRELQAAPKKQSANSPYDATSKKELEFQILETLLSTGMIVHITFKYFTQRPPANSSSLLQHILSLLSEEVVSFEITRVCLECLNQPCFENYADMIDAICEVIDFDEDHPFFNYATLNWVYHWKRAYQHSSRQSELTRESIQPLHVAACNVFLILLLSWLKQLPN